MARRGSMSIGKPSAIRQPRKANAISGNADGLNFLRINHPSPFNFQYFEIGNEVYGGWEMDEHGTGGDHLPMPAGKTLPAHDPTTYVSFIKQFQTLADEIDPAISIGIDSGATDSSYNNWLANVLIQSNSSHQNVAVGFISDHIYDQGSGEENDTTLLNDPSTALTPTPANPWDLVTAHSGLSNLHQHQSRPRPPRTSNCWRPNSIPSAPGRANNPQA